MNEIALENVSLAEKLRNVARRYDAFISHPSRMQVSPRYGDVRRDVEHPPHVEMNAEEKTKATAHGWYVGAEALLAKGPEVFTALDGTEVKKGTEGYRNPYGPTGLSGPGVLGVTRLDEKPVPESRAIDIVLQFIDPVDGKLKFIGGTRTDTGQPCFIGGFQEEDILGTAVREFIEEGISGSIDLQKHAPHLAALCEATKNGTALSENDKIVLQYYGIPPDHFTGDVGETVYHFIAKEDPAFVGMLQQFFKAKLSIAYQGPSRADPRNTDDRWIATTLLTGFMDVEEINALLFTQQFPYRFAAGSDLTDLHFHEVRPDFVLQAYASHGPLACIATAQNLEKMGVVSDAVRGQCEQLIAVLEKCMGGNKEPAPTRPPEPPANAICAITDDYSE